MVMIMVMIMIIMITMIINHDHDVVDDDILGDSLPTSSSGKLCSKTLTETG